MFNNLLKGLEDIIISNDNNMYNALEECILMCYNDSNIINEEYKNTLISLLLPIINSNNFKICDCLDKITVKHTYQVRLTHI